MSFKTNYEDVIKSVQNQQPLDKKISVGRWIQAVATEVKNAIDRHADKIQFYYYTAHVTRSNNNLLDENVEIIQDWDIVGEEEFFSNELLQKVLGVVYLRIRDVDCLFLLVQDHEEAAEEAWMKKSRLLRLGGMTNWMLTSKPGYARYGANPSKSASCLLNKFRI